MRSPRDPPVLPGTPGPAPADTNSAAPRPPACKHHWANRSSSLRAPHQLRTPGHRHRDGDAAAPSWAPHPPGTSTPQIRHPSPRSSPRHGCVSPRGGREHGGGRGSAASPCQAPAAGCSCHITILPGACPNNRRDCGGRKPEGHGAASGAGLTGDPNAAPQCPAQCPPHGTSGLGRVPAVTPGPNAHPAPWSLPSAAPSPSGMLMALTWFPRMDHGASPHHRPHTPTALPRCCCPRRGSTPHCQLRSALEKNT